MDITAQNRETLNEKRRLKRKAENELLKEISNIGESFVKRERICSDMKSYQHSYYQEHKARIMEQQRKNYLMRKEKLSKASSIMMMDDAHQQQHESDACSSSSATSSLTETHHRLH